MKSNRSYSSIVILSIVSISVLSGCSDWTPSKVAESQRRGNTIIAALEAFYADNGDYPPKLTALIPKYLAAIEQPTAGTKEWHYHPYEENSAPAFNIFFTDGEDVAKESYYLSTEGVWREVDESF